MNKTIITYSNNIPINMSLVISLARRHKTNIPPRGEMFFIVFAIANNKDLLWNFETEKERNIIYEKIMRKFSINLIGEDNFFAQTTITNIDEIK